MRVGARISIAGVMLGLLALAGCGRGFFQEAERAPWRREAEVSCLKSGAVKFGSGIVRIEPIEGPGMCGADFPLKVAALGEGSALTNYADAPRPPAAIPGGSASALPRWPATPPRYAPPPIQSAPVAEPIQRGNMRWISGPPAVTAPRATGPGEVPDGPMSIAPPESEPQYVRRPVQGPMPGPVRRAAPMGEAVKIQSARPRPDDIPDDAVVPEGGSAAAPAQRGAYNAPVYEPPPGRRDLPRLGPMRGPASVTPAAMSPPATLACPMVSALDRWVGEGVQPAAQRWFGSPVVSMKQISAYSCRRMVGAGSDRISEHAFGNALDIAAFTLADGRTITVEHGWRGTPEEQGFLHDVQLFACQTFNTVLGPGYNAAHYNHFHVDLMQRASGRRPCRPDAIPGEVAAARARAQYAGSRRDPDYTGSIGASAKAVRQGAVAGEDGYVEDEEDEDDAPVAKAPASTGSLSFPLRAPMKNGARPESFPSVTY